MRNTINAPLTLDTIKLMIKDYLKVYDDYDEDYICSYPLLLTLDRLATYVGSRKFYVIEDKVVTIWSLTAMIEVGELNGTNHTVSFVWNGTEHHLDLMTDKMKEDLLLIENHPIEIEDLDCNAFVEEDLVVKEIITRISQKVEAEDEREEENRNWLQTLWLKF